MNHRVLATICLAILGTTAAGRAEVRIVSLAPSNLVHEVPEWRGLGILPGDVLARNDFLEVVLFAVEAGADRSRLGTCLVRPRGTSGNGSESYTRIEPGPAKVWEVAEAGSAHGQAVLHFKTEIRHVKMDLVYRLGENQPFLEMMTTIRNLDDSTIARLPVVDQLHADGPIASQAGALLFNQSRLALIPMEFTPDYVSSPKGELAYVGYRANDPQPSLVQRMGRRITRFGRSGTLDLIAANRDWPASLQNSDHWHYIPGQASRTVRRRIVVANQPELLEGMIELARGEGAPTIELVPVDPSLSPPRRTATRPNVEMVRPNLELLPVPVDAETARQNTKPVDVPREPNKLLITEPIEAASPSVPVERESLPVILPDEVKLIEDMPEPLH